MTLYLTDQTSAAEIKKAHASGIVKAVKLYPAGATTNSDSGVTDIAKVAYALLLPRYECRHAASIFQHASATRARLIASHDFFHSA
jgi:dihydroorotase